MKIGFRGFLMLVVLGMIIGVLLNMQIGGVSAKQAYVPVKTDFEVQMEIKEAVFDHYWWIAFWVGIVTIIILGGIAAILRFLIIPAQKESKSYYRDESGRYAMIRENKATIWQRLRGISIWVESDPNLAITPTRRIKVLTDGEMEVAADTYGADMETQARHASKQIDVDKISAGHALGKIQKIPGGSGAYILNHADRLAESGYYDAKSREAKMRGLAAETNLQNAQIRQQKMIEGPAKGSGEEIEEERPVVKYLTFQESIDQSTPTRWLIGQATNLQPKTKAGIDMSVDGKLMVVDPTKTHVAILGGTGGGKTASSAFNMVYHARRSGFHVICFDGKRGIDWKTLDGVVEWYDMRPGNMYGYIKQIMSIYEERSEYLQSLDNIPNIYQDPTSRYQPIFLLIEEFGNTWRKLGRKNSTEKDTIEGWMDELFSMGRACGIILCLVDQCPQDWSPQMRSNAKFSVVYNMNGSGANEFKEYHVDQLNTGYFSRNNVFYRAWHVAEEVDLASEFSMQPNRLLDLVTPEQVEQMVSDDSSKKKSSKKKVTHVDSVIDPDPIIDRREPVTEIEYSLQRIYDRDKNMKHKKWQAFVRQYIKLADQFPEDHPMRKYPVAEIADRMAVCELGRYDKDLSDRRKSQASQWYSKIMAEQQPEQPEPVIAGMSISEWQEIPV